MSILIKACRDAWTQYSEMTTCLLQGTHTIPSHFPASSYIWWFVTVCSQQPCTARYIVEGLNFVVFLARVWRFVTVGMLLAGQLDLSRLGFALHLGWVWGSVIPMADFSELSLGCQVCSTKFFHSAWPELQHLLSLVTSGISTQLTAHPHTLLPHTYFLPGLVESCPIDAQPSIWPKTQGTLIYRLLELFLCTARAPLQFPALKIPSTSAAVSYNLRCFNPMSLLLSV